MKWVLTAIFFLTFVTSASAQELNAGFVEGLWYDHETVFAERPTRIYVAIRNNTGADLTGTVEFFVDDKRIERDNVSAINGHIITSWADWTPSYGDHTISATLSRIELHKVGSSTEAVTITSALAEDSIFVDYDTDKDGIGNKEDEDDDGDGMSDKEEKTNKTDPLDPSSPSPVVEAGEGKPDNQQSNTNKTEGENTSINRSNNGPSSLSPSVEAGEGKPEGLEQYLTESRADTALTSITHTINTTKKRIDDYRDSRNASLQETQEAMDEIVEAVGGSSTLSTDVETEEDEQNASSTSNDKTNENGFGEVTRTESKDVGILVKLIEMIRQLIASVYTLTLFLISAYLGHPIIVQITLLFLILFLVYKVAKRLGQRPQ